MMNNPDPLDPSPFNNSKLTKWKERTPFNQVMTCKASSMRRITQVVHRVAQKSYRWARQLLCCPLDRMLYEKLTWCPAQNHQPIEDKTTQALRSLPSTILIVNINNSTLIDCVIGNDTFPPVVAESQPLMQQFELQMHDPVRCSCSSGQQGAAQTSPPPPPHLWIEPPSINIHSSHLNCVIIGDNNYMHAEQTHAAETDEPQV